MPSSSVYDTLSVAVTGTPGVTQVSLSSILQQAYGDLASSISSVRVFYDGSDVLEHATDADGNPDPFTYWGGDTGILTSVTEPGVNLVAGTAAQENAGTVMALDVPNGSFDQVMINIGNNIDANVYIQIPTSQNSDLTANYQTLNVTTIPQNLVNLGLSLTPIDTTSPHVNPIQPGAGDSSQSVYVIPAAPTAADIAQEAEHVAAVEKGITNENDCHNIAMDIAAAVGAPLAPFTWDIDNPSANQEGGYWRIAFAGGGIDGNPAN
jgi:hypothetical protein